MQTLRVRPAPVVLVAGCSPAFVRRCGQAAILGQALAVEIGLVSLRSVSTNTRPVAVVMLAAAYATDPALFSAAAKEAGTRLVLVPDEQIPQAELERRILDAMAEAEAESSRHPHAVMLA